MVVGGEDSTKVVRVARTEERQCLVESDNTGLCGEGRGHGSSYLQMLL